MKPNLDGPLGHANILGDTFPDRGRRRRVSDELFFKSEKLFLCCPLPFLILLLLSKSGFARRSARCGSSRRTTSSGDGGRRCWRRHPAEITGKLVPGSKFHNIRREAAKYLDMKRLEEDLLVDVEVGKDRPQMSRRLTRRDSSEESAAIIKKGRQVV